MSEFLPLGVVALAWAINPRVARYYAADGRFGALVLAQGCKRKLLASRAEVEKRFGPIGDAKLVDAWARYHRGEHLHPSQYAYRNVRPGSAS